MLRGGEGDDVLAIGDTGFRRLVGGRGTDTIQFDGSGMMLDLTALPGNSITGIEVIDPHRLESQHIASGPTVSAESIQGIEHPDGVGFGG